MVGKRNFGNFIVSFMNVADFSHMIFHEIRVLMEK